MKIEVIRKDFGADHTISDIMVNGKFECFCIEDVVRPEGSAKVPGKTAIPYGSYKVIINMSNRFKRELPLLLSVPGFEGVRIHPGNTAADTEGCLLPGTSKQKGRVLQSVIAFNKLFGQMKTATLNKEEITIEIKTNHIQNFV